MPPRCHFTLCVSRFALDMKCMEAAQKLLLLPQVEDGVQVLLLSTSGLAKPDI